MTEHIERELMHVEREVSHEYHRILRNPWAIATIILAVVLVVGIFLMYTGKLGGSASTAEVEKNIMKFAEDRGIQNITVKEVKAAEGLPLYEITLVVNGEETPVYTTKDGKYLVASPDVFLPLTEEASDTTTPTTQTTQPPVEVPKTAKPIVELFVMTFCPYGTQAEKGLIPTIKALGTKADIKIRFVHYFMHGDKEEQETYNQVCIREEQPTKYLAYLECFLGTDGSAAGPTACFTKAGVDQAKLKTCVETKAKEYYAADSALSNKYGVQGSPTLIINGVESSAGRNSQSYLSGICAAFNTAPTECTKKLDSANPNPGFGYAASSGAAASASCG